LNWQKIGECYKEKAKFVGGKPKQFFFEKLVFCFSGVRISLLDTNRRKEIQA